MTKSSLIPAEHARAIAVLMGELTQGPLFIANRKIASAFLENRRAVSFSVGDLIRSGDKAMQSKPTNAQVRAAQEEARKVLLGLAGLLEEAGYWVKLVDADGTIEINF